MNKVAPESIDEDVQDNVKTKGVNSQVESLANTHRQKELKGISQLSHPTKENEALESHQST